MASAAMTRNTPPRRDFSLPRSPAAESRADSRITAIAKAKTGMARNVANVVTGRTAPSSAGETYFGTNQSPAARLTTSPTRRARKRNSACRQNALFALIPCVA